MRIKYGFVLLLSLCLTITGGIKGVAAETGTAEIRIQYDQLKERLKEGNLTLSQTLSDYRENVEFYQEMRDILKWEQSKMEDNAEDYVDTDEEASALYSSNASMLKRSASMIYSQIKTMTDTKSTKSLEKAANTYTMAAQVLMNSYHQIVWNRKAAEKSAAAAEAEYQAAGRKQEAGLMTAEELKTKENQWKQEENSCSSLREEEKQLRYQLLTMLGIQDSEQVVIEEIPEPDIQAILSIDFETDKNKAVNNSSTVIDTRHTAAKSSAQFKQRASQVKEAEGSAAVDITSLYDALQVSYIQYQGAREAFESAELDYQSLQRKKEAGLISDLEYLSGDAQYAQKEAGFKTASLNLVQIYETYCWKVKGIGE